MSSARPTTLADTILKAGIKCGFKKRETKDLVIYGHDQTI
jgi:hypothetical protein